MVESKQSYMRRLRISAISYLNTAPLMWDFEHEPERTKLREQFDLTYTIPSACATSLRDGTADIGIIPAAAYASIPGLLILPGVAIAAQNAVRSILLVSHKPLAQVKSVAMDTSSMTSVALCKVLLERWLGGSREYTPMAPDLDKMLGACDAALLIGDPALLVDRSRYVTTLDLAEEWRRSTGKPFVFAFWAVREAAMEHVPPGLNLSKVFQRSRDHGLEALNIKEIVQEWAPRFSLSKQSVRSYLTENIHYSLDAGCLEGLRFFYESASETGALPKVPELRFLSAGTMETGTSVMKVGSLVRLNGIPDGLEDYPDLPTKSTFEKCVGRTFVIAAFNDAGMAELGMGSVTGNAGEKIWVRPEFLDLVSS